MTELRPCTVLLAAVLLFSASALQAQTPPRDLHLVGDHWTAWDPPTDLPDGANVHIIERGDTLWDLAATFYGDPYLWPQLWEQNRYILDAHWIYPGDPLLIDVEVTSADEYAESVADAVPGEGGDALDDDPFRGVLTSDEAAGPPVPLGAEADIYCSGFIASREEDLPYELIGSEFGALRPQLGVSAGGDSNWRFESGVKSTRFDLSTGDVVYLDGGRIAGLAAGQILSVVQPGEMVRHPLNRREVIGRYYDSLARVRVLSAQEETGIGESLDSCAPVTVGARLRVFQPEPLPLGRRTRMRPLNFPASAEELADAPAIVRSEDRLVSLGQGSLVYIDRGEADDVLPGDIFTIYRSNDPGLPPILLGELAVLSVEEGTALARIVESRYTVYLGDRLDLKR
jgi:hypothetical protein